MVATYSSVFICSPMLIYLGLRSEGRAEAPAEGGERSVAALEAPAAEEALEAQPAPAAAAKPSTPKKSGGKGAAKRSKSGAAKS